MEATSTLAATLRVLGGLGEFSAERVAEKKGVGSGIGKWAWSGWKEGLG